MTPEPMIRTKSGRTDADYAYQNVKKRLDAGEDVPEEQIESAGYGMLLALMAESEED